MKLKTGYTDLKHNDLADLGDTAYTNMNGKPLWDAFKALIAQIAADVTALRTAMQSKDNNAHEQVQAAAAKLAATLGAVADDANRTTGVTDVDLASTGLPAAKPRTHTTEVPNAPANLRLRHGKMPSTVDGTVDPIPGGNIRTFEGQWSHTADGPWSETFSFPNSRAIHFAALERGKDTWFRVRARNVIGAGPWSDPAFIMVT